MLTLDDLEHFADASLAHLFAPPAGRADADRVARLARIVACLNACRDVPTEELVDGALSQARFHLRSALRRQQRSRRPDAAALLAAVEDALTAMGEAEEDGAAAAPERLEVEAEIEAAAARLADAESADPELLASLAQGEFRMLPSSDLAPLADMVGKFGAASAQVDVDLTLDQPGQAHFARVRLMLEGGLWRWTAQDGCCMSRNGMPAFFLPPDDPVVQALLAGLALRNGRTALAWAEAA